jgi:ABC-2 type transport system ATP-binding protein
VQEYLLMIASLRGIEESRRVRLISEAVYATGLAEYLTRPIQTLSKGYRQRVGIAQAILHRPDLLILDEPTTGLDPNQIVEIRDLIRELSEHSTVILSTHILSEVEMSCERVLIVMRGEVRADSRLADLRADSAAVVAVEAGAKAVEHALREIDGVQRVERIDQDGNYVRWRVAGSHKELCPAIYEVVRRREWGISELRPDSRTLESVFRSLAEQVEAGIVRDAGAAAGHERAGAAQQAGAPGAAVS